MLNNFWTPATIRLANNLLPKELENKTKAQIKKILIDNNDLRAALNGFATQTNTTKTYRQRRRFYGKYKLPWKSVGDIKNVTSDNMILLNYLIFVPENADDLSIFCYAVKESVALTYYVFFRKSMISEGRSFCKKIV